MEWTPLHEVLARAYVRGWRAGREGARSDEGKRATAEVLAETYPQIMEQVKAAQDDLRLAHLIYGDKLP